MHKLNLVLMVVLAVAVIGGAAYLSTGQESRSGPDTAKIERLIRLLGDPDPDISRDAESDLRSMGPVAHPALRKAAGSSDRRVADRALRLLPSAHAP